MQSLKQFWGSFRLLPSAWLLLVQLALLVMAMLTYGDSEYRALTWSLGVLEAAQVLEQHFLEVGMYLFGRYYPHWDFDVLIYVVPVNLFLRITLYFWFIFNINSSFLNYINRL